MIKLVSLFCMLVSLVPSSARAVNVEMGLDTVFVMPFNYDIYLNDSASPDTQTVLSSKPSGVGLGAFLSLQFMDQHRIALRYQGAKIEGTQEYDLSGVTVVEDFTSSYNQLRLDFDILFDLGSRSRWVVGFDLGYIWLNTQNLEVNTKPFGLPEEVDNNHRFFGIGLHTGFEIKYDFLYFGLYLSKTIDSKDMSTSSLSPTLGEYEIIAPKPLILSTSIGFVF